MDDPLTRVNLMEKCNGTETCEEDTAWKYPSSHLGKHERQRCVLVQCERNKVVQGLSLIHISEPTRPERISYAAF